MHKLLNQRTGILGSSLIARLDHLLSFNIVNETSPFLRLAYLFTQGLKSRTARSLRCRRRCGRQFQSFRHVGTPDNARAFVKFAHFTANQAILEAADGDPEVHVIDFDVMEGIQWPPLMVELANGNNGAASLQLWHWKQMQTLLVEQGEDWSSSQAGLALRFDQVQVKDIEWLQVSRVGSCSQLHAARIKNPQRKLGINEEFLAQSEEFVTKIGGVSRTGALQLDKSFIVIC